MRGYDELPRQDAAHSLTGLKPTPSIGGREAGDPIAMPTLDESRQLLLDVLDSADSPTIVRPYGNIGDELIWAGTRELLGARIHREISVDDLSSERGELAVISGGGGWCRAFNEFMPEVLEIAEQRFERVVVLPSTFEVDVERVRSALARTSALVFAREPVSYAAIRDLCDARLAHDCAFFADLSRFTEAGSGTLVAFRTDAERAPNRPGDDLGADISATAGSLEAWLAEISRHQEVTTDRAHVMIAGALMGKRVTYAEGNYFKLGAIALSCLGEYDVQPIPVAAREVAHDTPRLDAPDDVLVLTVDQLPELTGRLASHPEAEFVLILDAGQRPPAGAIESLVDALRATPDALAAAPELVSQEGRSLGCGGWLAAGESSVELRHCSPGDATERCDWAPTAGGLFRASALKDRPIAALEAGACRDADWALRARGTTAAPPVVRVQDAQVETAASGPLPPGETMPLLAPRLRVLESHAVLFDRHGVLMPGELAELIPELNDADGLLDERRARLLLELTRSRGATWVLARWLAGDLEALIGREIAQRINELEQRDATLSAIEAGTWWQLRGRLQPLRRALGKTD